MYLYKYALIFVFICSLFSSLYSEQNKESSPTLTYKLLRRYEKPDKGPTAEFILIAENIPTLETFILEITRITSNKIVRKKAMINENNELVSLEDNKTVIFTGHEMPKGEPFFFTAIGKKNKWRTPSCIVVPFPIETKDENGHHLEVMLGNEKGDMFVFRASGFKPKESVQIFSTSGHENRVMDANAAKDGTFYGTLDPARVDAVYGTATIEVKGKTTTDLKATYDWGYKALEPFKVDKT